MSAREDLTNELLQWCSATEMEWVEASFDQMKKDILHEAAEKIRSLRNDCRYDPDSTQYQVMSGSADLIDPEVGR